jgi:hypothetical protein
MSAYADKKIYLTIDVDFWQFQSDAKAVSDILSLLDGIPVNPKFYKEHHKILPDIYELGKSLNSKIGAIVNVDYHSDLGGYTEEEKSDYYLDCGSWADIANKKKDVYEIFDWYYPSKRCVGSGGVGYCHGDYENPFLTEDSKTFNKFGEIGKAMGLPKFTEEEKANIVGVSIILSKDYGGSERVFDTLKKFYK